jgi:uncharacterized protein YkwD
VKPAQLFYSLLVLYATNGFAGASGIGTADAPSQPQKDDKPPLKYKLVADRIGASKNAMTLAAARLYVLSLVNADRAKFGIVPLKLDTVANEAAQMHSDEMAILGYCSHTDTRGNAPWHRYNACGGEDCVGENLETIELPPGYPMIAAKELKIFQSLFMSEKPPNDLHRLQILSHGYNKIGIGVSYALNGNGAGRLLLAQEFVSDFGDYLKLPKKLVRGVPFEIAGTLASGVRLDSIVVDWEPLPDRKSIETLKQNPSVITSDQGLIMAELSPLNEPDIVRVHTEHGRQHFIVQITPDKNWKPGRYGVQVLAIVPGVKTTTSVSLRTVYMD